MKATLHGVASLAAGMGRRMKLQGSHNQSIRAMTLTEVIVAVFVVLLLAVVLLPVVAYLKPKNNRINCVNNLKEVGLAYKIWEGDNNDKYPAQVSVLTGGAMELAATGNVVAVYQCMSNELSTPKILYCYNDTSHRPATNFLVGFTAKNISYFAGLDASPDQPQTVLTGDANLELNDQPVGPGVLSLGTNIFTWTKDRHKFGGYIVLSDGSAAPVRQMGFTTAPETIFYTNRLAIP